MNVATRLKIRIYSIIAGILLLAFGGFYFALPPVSDRIELFHLQDGYTSIQEGKTKVFFHKESTTEDEARKFALSTQQFAQTMVRNWGESLGLEPIDEFTLRIFASPKDYDLYFDAANSKTSRSEGLYDTKNRSISVKYQQHYRTARVLKHECVHFLIDLAKIGGSGSYFFPVWLNEGLAKFFEHGPNGSVHAPKYTNSLPKIDIRRLMVLEGSEFYAEENAYEAYKASYSLVSFFMLKENPVDKQQKLGKYKYRDKFLHFAKVGSRRGETFDMMALNYFDCEGDALLEEWLEYATARER